MSKAPGGHVTYSEDLNPVELLKAIPEEERTGGERMYLAAFTIAYEAYERANRMGPKTIPRDEVRMQMRA